jgi:hypothetical protein
MRTNLKICLIGYSSKERSISNQPTTVKRALSIHPNLTYA